MRKHIFIVFFLIIGLLVAGCSTTKTNNVDKDIVGPYDEIAKCLTDKGVKMYGTEWCGFCKMQKGYFNVSFQHVDYVNCDENKPACQEAGIQGYPTWIIEGEQYPGAQDPEALAEIAGC